MNRTISRQIHTDIFLRLLLGKVVGFQMYENEDSFCTITFSTVKIYSSIIYNKNASSLACSTLRSV